MWGQGVVHIKIKTVVHTFNPSTEEAQAMNSRPYRSTQQAPGQPGIHRVTLLKKKKKWIKMILTSRGHPKD